MSSVFPNDLLAGKSAFISGGTSGVGLGIAEGLAAHGARVVIFGRDEKKAERAAKMMRDTGGKASHQAGDVRNPENVEAALSAAVEAHGPLDIVVACAAGNFLASASDLSPNGFKSVVDIDLLGTFNTFRLAFPKLRTPGASLIAILAGQATHPVPMQAHACAAKAGVAMLIKCLALEWGPHGIRVNGLTPGPVDATEGMRRLLPENAREAFLSKLPMRRMATIEEIAQAALYLCSDAATYVSGTALEVDGASQWATAMAD